METLTLDQEATTAGDVAAYAVTKGKRTKRQRLLLLPSSPASDTTTEEAEEEEDMDMANCLILLAQGRSMDVNIPHEKPPEPAEKFRSRRFAETATTTTNAKAGFYVYECKTCSKCFPSFQALGGHRASHKKPKTAPTMDSDGLDLSMNSFVSKPLGHVVISGKKIHECSVCGAEFSSGQALGGHMRRHRPIGPEMKKEERMNGLSLDLNLPAPAEDFGFSEKPPAAATIAFSASALVVDCHY